MTPTGSWPTVRPSFTGYSPFRMWTSVPQIVVSVTRISASPTPGTGRGTSRSPIFPFPSKTAARIAVDIVSPFASSASRPPSGRGRLVHQAHRLGHLLQARDARRVGRGERDGHALRDVLDLDLRVRAAHAHRAEAAAPHHSHSHPRSHSHVTHSHVAP